MRISDWSSDVCSSDLLAGFAGNPDEREREAGIVLPVGCGKSGCIALAPFAFRATRTLVVAPGLKIAEQLPDDFDPARQDMFYITCGVLTRSEERRVGKEGVSKVTFRGAQHP